MIIGIDGNEANVTQQVGVSVYTTHLLTYFHKNASEDLRFRVYLKKKPRDVLPPENTYFTYHVIPGAIGWSQLFFPLYLYGTKKCDILFCPAHYAPRFSPVPFVVTIHDLSYYYYPQEFLKKDLYKLKNWTHSSVKRAQHVICVSKTTKKDVLKWFQIPDSQVSVVYNGYEKITKNEPHTQNKHISSIPTTSLPLKKTSYILYVGTLQPRKNIQTLIDAFSDLVKDYPDYKLVLVGKKGWLFNRIFSDIQNKKLNEQVICTGYVTDAELEALYKNAVCYVLPSLYEGFGIPILEALSYGCPVIASYASSLPEIGGDACLYFNPNKPEELTDKIRLFISDPTIRTQCKKMGKERIKQFSWNECGKQTLAVIQENIEKKYL